MANINYLRSGDYFIPDIQLSVVSDTPLGKYARMRRAFLEANNPMLLSDLILTEKLFPHLWKVQQTCEQRMERMMTQLLDKNPAPEGFDRQQARGPRYMVPDEIPEERRTDEMIRLPALDGKTVSGTVELEPGFCAFFGINANKGLVAKCAK